jgi:hypothetical protein
MIMQLRLILILLVTILLAALMLSAGSALAQTKPPVARPKPAIPLIDTLKPLHLQPQFGIWKATNSTAFLADFKKALALELKVKDSASGVFFAVQGFRLGWRKKEASDDYKTGRRKVITTFNAVQVEGAKMPEAWQKEMNDALQPTEEVLFEQIMVLHPVTKRLYLAPSLVIKLR